MEKKKERHYYPIFDRKGKSGYYLDQDKIHIYSWEGTPVAFVDKGAVFDYNRRHLAYYDEGWLRDKEGKCVGFAEPGRGGPNPPKTRPPADPPAAKKEAPELPEITEHPGRPIRKPIWSDLSEDDLFGGISPPAGPEPQVTPAPPPPPHEQAPEPKPAPPPPPREEKPKPAAKAKPAPAKQKKPAQKAPPKAAGKAAKKEPKKAEPKPAAKKEKKPEKSLRGAIKKAVGRLTKKTGKKK